MALPAKEAFFGRLFLRAEAWVKSRRELSKAGTFGFLLHFTLASDRLHAEEAVLISSFGWRIFSLALVLGELVLRGLPSFDLGGVR
jgi:hypothetical protein